MALLELHAPQQGVGELGLLSAFTPCHHAYWLGDSPLHTITPILG